MRTLDKPVCTGCGACFSICPISCISMKQDTEGFLYPVIDDTGCTQCKKCEKTCSSIMNKGVEHKPLNVYAAKNHNEEIRYQSSSGGIFSLLAESVIREGGVVFGARFNNTWEVIHEYTETIEALNVFRGSKYVQSITGDTYKQAKGFLENSRKVLYSGTPCQIAGLKAFLKRDYDNILTLDFVCHGVPSPLVWKKYLGEVVNMPDAQILKIKFRDKKYGWKHYHFVLTYSDKGKQSLFIEASTKNSFMKGFIQNLYLRPSCHNCPVKSLKSGSDITIADYWGIQDILPEFDDDKGISLVMTNTEKGEMIYRLINKADRKTTYAEAVLRNSCIEKSVFPHQKRVLFFKKLHAEPIIPLVNRLTIDSQQSRFKSLAAALLRCFGLLTFAKSFLRK